MTQSREIKKEKAIWKADMKALLGDNWRVLSNKHGIYNVPTNEQARQELLKDLKI